MCPLPRRSRSAFTLVELLAVVGIVLLLLSLLVPSLSSARSRAETAVCISQLRQISTATDLYSGDQQGQYPDPWRWVWSDGASGNWQYTWVEWARTNAVTRGSLYAYMGGSDRAYLCPTFKKTAGLNPAFSHLTPFCGYSMNEYLTTWVTYQSWNGRPKILRTQVQKPAEFGVFGDEATLLVPGQSTVWINNLCLGVGPYNAPGLCDSLAGFHNAPGEDPTRGRGNAAFADGHVALCDPADSKEIFTPAIYK